MSIKESTDSTFYENLYDTQVLPPWTSTKQNESGGASAKDYTVLLNDKNVTSIPPPTKIGWKGRVNYSISQFDEERERTLANRDEFYRDPNKLLEISITTIILMAIGKEVSNENIMYTELYLRNIRDRYGDHPRNISKLLKYMVSLKRQNNVTWEDQFYIEPPATLQLSKISNPSRIPVRKE